MSVEVAEYVWLGAGVAGGAMREPSRAWGASAEEIQMNCGRWVGALVAVHPCGRQGVTRRGRVRYHGVGQSCVVGLSVVSGGGILQGRDHLAQHESKHK